LSYSRLAAGILALLFGSGTVRAQASETPQSGRRDAASAASATAQADTSQSQAPDSKKRWQFSTIGYIYFAGAYGKTTPRDPLPTVGIHLPFGDVLKAFKFGFMGAADARHDRLVFLGDLMWVHLGGSQGLKVRDVNFADVKIDTKTWEITALGGYRIADKGPVVVDLLAGGRLNGNKQEVDYHGAFVDASASVSRTWIDPVVATRIIAPLGGKFGMSLYGDIGGFGIGSKLSWQGIAVATYQINHKMTAGAGWRYFQINYHGHDGFIYDVHQTGPILSLRTVL
jgi:hypothetical protein